MYPILLGSGSDIPRGGLSIWLDAQDYSTITKDGSNLVSNWANKGTAADAVQATANNKPTYVASAINGHPALQGRLDNAKPTQMSIAYSTDFVSSNFTTFTVFQRVEDTGADESIFCRSTGTSLYRLRLSSDAPVMFTGNSGLVTGASTIAVGTPNIVWTRHTDTVKLEMQVNSETTVVDSSIGTLGSAVNVYELFSQNSAVPFDGYIGEHIHYTRALSDSEIAQVKAYLNAKWIGAAASTLKRMYLMFGQSNSGGQAPNTELSATYTGAMTGANVYVHPSDTWPTLQSGVNNRVANDGTNVAVYGAEMSMMYNLKNRYSNGVYLLKYWLGGAILYDGATTNGWYPDAVNGGIHWAGATNRVTAAFNKLTALGISGVKVDGIIWSQGESDANNATYAAAYQTNLTYFITRLRSFLYTNGYCSTETSARFILNTLPDIQPRTSSYLYWDTVKNAQLNVIAATDNAAWVEGGDLALSSVDNPVIHYTGASYETLGQRFAASIS